MVDLKKLITGFFVLAFLVGIIVFTFSSIFKNNGNGPEQLGSAGLKSQKISNDSSPGTKNQQTASISGISKPANNNTAQNLTQNFARNIVEEIKKANPDGPVSLDQDFGLFVPTSTITDAITSSTETFDLTDNFPRENIKIISNYSNRDLAFNINEINKILKETISSERYKNLAFSDTGDAQVAGAVLVLDQAIQRIAIVPTPLPFADAEQSFLTLLDHSKKIFEITIDDNDPLKAMVALKSAERITDRDLKNLNDQLDKVAALSPISKIELKERVAASFKNLWGVQKAMAQFGLGGDYVPVDCTGEKCTDFFKNTLKSFSAEIASTNEIINEIKYEREMRQHLEDTKKDITQTAARETVAWAKGATKDRPEGQPRYIENWGGYISNAGDQASNEVVKKRTGELCSAFAPIVEAAASNDPSYLASNNQQYNNNGRCNLLGPGTVSDVKTFYNDFDQGGGWEAYSNLIKPENNAFGSIAVVHDEALVAAATAEDAAKSEGIASQGYKSGKMCANAQEYTLADLQNKGVINQGASSIETEAAASLYASKLGKEYIPGSLTPNPNGTTFQACSQKDWKVITPGSSVANIVNNAIDLPLQNVIAAQDMGTGTLAIDKIYTDSISHRIMQKDSSQTDPAYESGLNDVFTYEPIDNSGPFGQELSSACARIPDGNMKQKCNAFAWDAYMKFQQAKNKVLEYENLYKKLKDGDIKGFLGDMGFGGYTSILNDIFSLFGF
ncbi:MAG: hypothetical protein WCX12_02950 [Candidatus Paceibacterota bacterium]|jgi:hypothetical protein